MTTLEDQRDDQPAGVVAGTLAAASGRDHRDDPVLPRTGGPAGNAVLTAWTGLVLLVLFVAELLTLLNIRGLITCHVAIGALLVPPALVKTGATMWRLVGYYRGNAAYTRAGPPPVLLRLLGPLVVLSTLALLATGALLVLIGDPKSQHVFVTLPLLRVNWVTLHQITFVVLGDRDRPPPAWTSGPGVTPHGGPPQRRSRAGASAPTWRRHHCAGRRGSHCRFYVVHLAGSWREDRESQFHPQGQFDPR